MRHAFIASLVIACSSSSGDECATAVGRLEAAMEGDISGGGFLPHSDPDVEVPERATGNVAVEVAPILTITPTLLLLDGRRLDTAGLNDDLQTLGRNWAILHPNAGAWDKRINVLADARAEFARVDEVLQPLAEQGYSFVLVAATPTEPAPPCPADWTECESLGTGDPATRARHVAEVMSDVLGSRCEEVAELFGRIATVEADQKATTLRSGLPAALRSCECGGVNMERLEWLVPVLLGTRDARAVGMPYEAGRTGTVGEWMSR